MNSQDPFNSIAQLKPDVVAYSSSTGEAKHYLRLNRLVKERYPQVFTIMGGSHPTFFPEVIYEDTLDAVCMGEGEEAFSDLLSAIQSKGPVDDIANIVTRKNKEKFTVRNLTEDLDSLPFPDYSLIYDNTPLGEYPLKSIITSRGCLYDCTYCFNSAWRQIYKGKGRAVRRHSVNYVIDEILYVKTRWPLSCVKFYDDIFTYQADNWLEDFSQKYKEKINLPFFILTRADLLTEEMVRLLKTAGCRTISMSIESGNVKIRENLLRRRMSDEQIIKAHQLCDKYGIYTFTNCMVGLPGTSITNDIESLELAIKSGVSWAEFPIFHPYPKTELGQRSIKEGSYRLDYSQMHTSYMYKSPLECFTKKERNAQANLAVLAGVAVVFPRYKKLITQRLIYLPHNIFFTFIYYLTKMYVLKKKIYVTKTNFWGYLSIFIKSLKQELFMHENNQG
jgi:radical SAM superfamily enzyme YgiQ (UPF0313 family)